MLIQKTHKGFTLIEILVSTAIFSIVMVIALGALLSLSEADRKAQTLSVAVNNMGSALDSMSRTIRTGVMYNCGSGQYGSVNDCTGQPGSPAGTYLSFTASNGAHVAYCLNSGVIMREIVPSGSSNHPCGSSGFVPLTPPDVQISQLAFYVIGSSSADFLQPKVTILLSGTVQVTARQTSAFNIQTTVTQRIYDQ